jgi:hypothetical protein
VEAAAAGGTASDADLSSVRLGSGAVGGAGESWDELAVEVVLDGVRRRAVNLPRFEGCWSGCSLSAMCWCGNGVSSSVSHSPSECLGMGEDCDDFGAHSATSLGGESRTLETRKLSLR